jgi:hypothetical protein
MHSLKKISYLQIGLVCLLVAYSFWSAAQELVQARQLENTDGPFFAAWEKRFIPIQAALPFRYGVIGYVSDWDIPGKDYDPANTEAEHILTQYALTPIVVSRDTSHEWILANLSADDFDTWFALQEGKFEVTKFKYNFYLVHRIR